MSVSHPSPSLLDLSEPATIIFSNFSLQLIKCPWAMLVHFSTNSPIKMNHRCWSRGNEDSESFMEKNNNKIKNIRKRPRNSSYDNMAVEKLQGRHRYRFWNPKIRLFSELSPFLGKKINQLGKWSFRLRFPVYDKQIFILGMTNLIAL